MSSQKYRNTLLIFYNKLQNFYMYILKQFGLNYQRHEYNKPTMYKAAKGSVIMK